MKVFIIESKTECETLYYHFKSGHKSNSFPKLVVNKLLSQKICNELLDYLSSLAISSNINFVNKEVLLRICKLHLMLEFY